MRNQLLWSMLLFPVLGAAQSTAALDRGLPKSYLNNDAGVLRSNVRWSWYAEGFIGDDFTLGSPGERWVVDKIRTWTVPGTAEKDPMELGDVYQDVRLYFGENGTDVTPIVSGRFTPGSSRTGNSAIAISDAATQGVRKYDEFGRLMRVWQVDFNTSGLEVEGGQKYRFGVWGQGRPDASRKGGIYPWFNLASNASLTDPGRDSADDLMLKFSPAGKFEGSFDGNGSGWDKSSDINVQVFAHKVATR